jgi:hypothetical protein
MLFSSSLVIKTSSSEALVMRLRSM